jgi:hypothetical protein
MYILFQFYFTQAYCLLPRCPASRTSSSVRLLPNALHPSAPQRAPNSVDLQPPPAVLPVPAAVVAPAQRAAAAWATGAAGPTDAGVRAPAPVTVAVVSSREALAVATALGVVADLNHEIK